MHEMTVTQAMLDMALEHARGHRITDIYLQVGRLSAIVPESVELYFEHLSKGTLAEGAALHFDVQPIQMTCMNCGREADLRQWGSEAPQAIVLNAITQGCTCGSRDLRVTGGVTFNMVSLEVEERAE